MSREPVSVETAVQRCREGSVSVGRAAELADVSVWCFIETLGERGVEVNYDETDLEADLRAVDANEQLSD